MCARLIRLAVINISYCHHEAFIREVWTSILGKLNETHKGVVADLKHDYGETPDDAIKDY